MKSWLGAIRPGSDYWRDVSRLALGAGAAQAINFATMPILTRLYDPSAFAILSVYVQAVSLVGLLVSLRFEYAILLPAKKRDAAALLLLVVGCSLTGVVAWTALIGFANPLLTRFFPNEPEELWLAVPLGAALMSMMVSLQHWAQREMRYAAIGTSDVLNKLTYFLVGTMLIFFVSPSLGLVGAFCIGSLVKCVWLLRGSNAPTAMCKATNRRRLWVRLVRQNLRAYSRMSRSMFASHLLLTATGLVPTLFIFSEYGADVLGQWALVVSTSYVPSALMGAAIGQVYFQRAAQAHAAGASIKPLWRLTTRKLSMIGIPTFLAFAAVSTWMYPLLFGSNWAVAGEFAVVMSASALLAFVTVPVDKTCIVVGAWRYIPLWHTSRLVSACLVAWLAHALAWSALVFVVAFTIQACVMYIVDFFAERHFASDTGSSAA